MITIDGSEGEGGGQILRNALALSLITGQPFRLVNIRGRRERPGLMRQHVTAIDAACQTGRAECEGVCIGASEIVFRPGRVEGGEYCFSIGTAGSTSLVLQTVLLPLMRAGSPSRLVLEGGTHNIWAPPFDFLDRCFLPALKRMGGKVGARLVRHGFHPRGGGRVEFEITPAPLHAVDCLSRGALLDMGASVLIAGLPRSIAEEEIRVARKHLEWPDDICSIRELPQDLGPGNILMLEARFEHVTEIVSGVGRLGVSARSIARTAAQRLAGYMATSAFAGPYLADQLILPLALAGGGSFTTVKPTQHTRTAADVISKFLDCTCRFDIREDGSHLVSIS
ncbi:MAG: RNA 3'-terminal phosphate cyclase [Parvibaculum sp.]|nr:RNA 3'-terminal phosphate cyclase [Parvibaculum sp.]